MKVRFTLMFFSIFTYEKDEKNDVIINDNTFIKTNMFYKFCTPFLSFLTFFKFDKNNLLNTMTLQLTENGDDIDLCCEKIFP